MDEKSKKLQLNSLMKDDHTEEIQNKQFKENNAKRKRAIAKERSRRFLEKKHLNVLKSVHHVVYSFHFCRVILSTHSFFSLEAPQIHSVQQTTNIGRRSKHFYEAH